MIAELERQRALLAALWRAEPGAEAALLAGLRETGVAAARGLQAYRANAGAAAERALAATYPVLRAAIGEEAFAGLSRAFWHARPPVRGDLGWLGLVLADFVEGDPQLADVPWLADLARFEWLVACAEGAADAPGSASERLATLHLLSEHEPDELFIALAPGAAVLRSAWPVASLWRAHRPDAGAEAFAEARSLLASRAAQTVFVFRPEWAARVDVVDEASACFLQSLVEGQHLAAAFTRATSVDPAWAFEAWLARAIGAGWLAGARHGAAAPGAPQAIRKLERSS